MPPPSRTLGLGIDAGGTYTDAVLYDIAARRLIAKAKALTTYHDLVVGVRDALDALPASELRRVSVTSLSTTLATNAVVEGRGHRVGLLVLCPWPWFAESIGHAPTIQVPGATDMAGEVLVGLDEDGARRAVRELVVTQNCASIAIAAYAAVRNPAMVNRLREIAREETDVPLVCSHEITQRLDGVQAARTAVANARLLPIVSDLLAAVRRALTAHGVPGRLMVLKGDGTPVDESIARLRPIDTILSGPAASVSGARAITGMTDALVIDIGGTTTDCAIVENGQVAVDPAGARVGHWRMSVDVADITTVGLGGDSRIDFTRDRVMTIGPRRSVPLTYAASQSTAIASWLRDFDERYCLAAQDASALDVLVRGSDCRLALSPAESRIVDLVASGPIPALEAAKRLGAPSHKLLPTERLESTGMLLRAGLTPTDLLHAADDFVRWDAEAAKRALALFAAMYGRSPEATMAEARRSITRKVWNEIVSREVSHVSPAIGELPANWAPLLDRAFDGSTQGLSVSFAMSRPVIAVGAPAASLVVPVEDHLNVRVIVPENADVANAIGAIAAEVCIRETADIRAGTRSGYVVHSINERAEFTDLASATDHARTVVRLRVETAAHAAGALHPAVEVSERDSTGDTIEGDIVFLGRRVMATATGSPFDGSVLSPSPSAA